MKKLILAALLAALAALQPAYAQCSDAGVCVLGKKHISTPEEPLSSLTLGYRFGSSGKDPDINGTLNDLTFNSVYVDADLALSARSKLNLSIPFTAIEGPLGSNSGLGDLSVLYSHIFTVKKKHMITFSVGGKIAIADINTRDSLPQRYMTGLGTNDLIAGFTYSYLNYSVSAAYQMTFGRSENVITRLKRGDDFFFRAGYGQDFGKLNIRAEILTIIRIQRSSIRSSNSVPPVETYISVQGSNEPQVSLLAAVGYRISDEISVSVDAAIPFLRRDYNYDGLKRSFTAGLGFSYLFKL